MNAEWVADRQSSSELLNTAVHRHGAMSMAGLQERLFTLAFSELVYPQIWEDPCVDLKALELTSCSRLVTIASGGCNVLSYLTRSPERIFAVDLNHAHVALNRLKFAAIRKLPDYETFFRFFGTAADKSNPALFDALMARDLDADTVTYWRRSSLLGRRNVDSFARGFYRTGLLGSCIGFAHRLALAHGVDPRCMMKAASRAEQVAIFERELAPLFDRPLIRLLLGHRAALIGLGIPPAQYDALLGNAGHMAEVVRERLRKLCCDFDLKDNYFAWQAFNRAYAEPGKGPLPPYLERENFATLKANIDRVSAEQISFTAFLDRQAQQSLDGYVLLDAQDWMDARALTELWTGITRTARPGARVIFRTAGHETILPGQVPDRILNRWRYEQARSEALHAEDRSAIYGGFHLYIFQG